MRGAWGRGNTSHVKFEHLQSLLVHFEAIQYLLAHSFQILSCCSYDWKVCSLEQASGKLKANASGGWRYQEPWLGHGRCDVRLGIEADMITVRVDRVEEGASFLHLPSFSTVHPSLYAPEGCRRNDVRGDCYIRGPDRGL